MRSSFIQNAMSLNPSLSQNRIDIFVRDNDSSRASCIEGGDDLTFSTTSSSDQFYYIIKIIRFPTILRWFIFLYLIFQILAIPVTFHMINLTSDNDFLHNFFRIVGYSSLTLAPDADAPYFMPLFIALIAIHVVEFLIFIVSDVFYWKFRYIPKPLCYIIQTPPKLITATQILYFRWFLYPIHFISRFWHNRKDIFFIQ